MRNTISFEDKVIQTIKKYEMLNDGDKIVLGVSGGPDSIAMLNVFKHIAEKYDIKSYNKEQMSDDMQNNYEESKKIKIIVAHINHMIRKEAIDDENYVRNYCEKNKIDFYSKSIDVVKIANNSKIGTEEAGRIVRYDFFDEVMKKTGANKIAIAHNKNDKVETIFMNLLRGSGIKGLRGIEPKRGKYIRPLIECERTEIEEYCKEKNLQPRIDKTNYENVYTRNKIRNLLIPYVKKEFNPNIIDTINRLSVVVSEEDDYMEKQVKNIYKEVLIQELKENEEKQIILDLKKFNMQEKVIKSRVIRYTITSLVGSTNQIEQVHIEDIIKLCNNNIGNKFLAPNKNLKVWVKNRKIYFIKQNT